MNRLIISISLIALICCTKPVVVKKNERFYQAKHCNSLNGQIEFKLNDNTRIDCLTSKLAIEYDWSRKWAECFSQALHYSAKTNKEPVCALIGTQKQFSRHAIKIKNLAEFYNIKLNIIHIQSR